MRPLAPITLEIVVLLLGIFLICAECVVRREDKRWMATTSIFVLAVVFAWSVLHHRQHRRSDLFNSFYSADAKALFFKRIALLTTMVVLGHGDRVSRCAVELHPRRRARRRNRVNSTRCPS